MILHLFPKSQFVEDYIFFVNQNFDMENHQFVLYTNNPYELTENVYDIKNVFDLDKKGTKWLIPALKRADKIIFHNISVTLPMLVRLYLNKKVVQKGIWLIWGGDLYCYRNKRDKLVDKIVEYMRAKVIQNMACIATIAEGDYELAKKWYHIDKQNIRVDYFSYKGAQVLSELPRHQTENNSHRLMIGNSATATNHHMEIFEQIEGIINEEWKVIVPLSYGEEEYGERIEKEGRRLFADSFVPIHQYMGKEEYFGLLNTIDVAAFNNDRQQATGNIMALAYLGKRIYMRSDTTMWEEFVNKKHFIMFDIRDLPYDLRKGKIHLTSEEREYNISLASHYYSVDDRIIEWRKCFEMTI